MLAKGTFEVKLVPQADTDTSVGRMSIDKQFQGDITGTSKGMMLAAMTGVPNSAGYVAIEKVSGTLHGMHGTFVLQHSSTMARGVPTQSITVIPDSGTDELKGLAGSLIIVVVGKKHSYEFAYTIQP